MLCRIQLILNAANTNICNIIYLPILGQVLIFFSGTKYELNNLVKNNLV